MMFHVFHGLPMSPLALNRALESCLGGRALLGLAGPRREGEDPGLPAREMPRWSLILLPHIGSFQDSAFIYTGYIMQNVL